jgi:AcrR family transcriptional regulator
MATRAAARERVKPKQLRAERTRLRLVEAARKLFTTKGYAETSIEDIATAVQASKGAFYFHFGSKDGVLWAVLEGWAAARLAKIRSAARLRDANEAATRLIRVLVSPDAAGKRDGRILFLFWSEAVRDVKLRQRLITLLASWSDLLDECLARAGVAPEKRQTLVEVVLALHDGILARTLTGQATSASWRAGAEAAASMLSALPAAEPGAEAEIPEFLRRDRES